MRKTITGPLNQMKQATDKFSYDNETDHQNNIDIMENLNINTGDEIEDIYHLFITFMKNNLDFMRNLSRAENDIKFKNSQIGKISNAAYKDSLTGVRSKAAYNKMVEELNKEINVGKKNFAVVMIDLNNLKKINDEFGHEAGDSYIKGCCQIICDVFKPAPIYRIGGDEFVVILRGTNYANRHDLIDSIKKAYIDSFKNETADPWLRYSAAVGSADCSSDDLVFETVFKRADKAMYDAKKEFKSNYGSYR